MTSHITFDRRAFARREGSYKSALTLDTEHQDHVQSIETDAFMSFRHGFRKSETKGN